MVVEGGNMPPPKKIRWACPNGHPGVLGSTRPPKDSIIRYCLKCSAETGRLVERIAPALERKRAAAADTAAAKAKAKRQREAAAKKRRKLAEDERYTVGGVDLREEMKRLVKLRAFGGKTGRLFRNPPELVISRRSKYPASRLGYAEPWRNRISVCTYPGQTLADARETLVHELAHIVVGRSGTEGWHGPQFKQTMTQAFKEAYRVLPLGAGGHSYHGRYAAALERKEKAS
jgi:hypothetical protein